MKNQLALAYEGTPELIDEKLNTSKSIDEIFRQAQTAFNAWSKLPIEQRTTDTLLKALDFDFFEVLDSVTIARSRKHIEKYYNTEKIGKFPERRKPITKRPNLTDLPSAINYNQIYEQLSQLQLEIYTPSVYIFPSKMQKYIDLTHNKGNNLTQSGREEGIRRLMSVNLLKRLESSVASFRLTLGRIRTFIVKTIDAIDQYEKNGSTNIDMYEAEASDFDMEDQNTDYFTVGKKVKIDLADMDYKSWRNVLQHDADTLELLILMVADITPEHDTKLQTLLKLISEKVENPINLGNKKVLIFSAFSDTAEYLYENISLFAMQKYGLHSAMISGTVEGRTTLKGLKPTFNNILTCFSPVSKDRDVLMPGSTKDIDILIATDCISEGQNLQDCDYCVNYDIHWNPVRIIQRFGRIDRIGSHNAQVETRMKISVMTSTGDDNPISPEEQGDLEYRKQQLKKLQDEVVDIEDMSSGISIMDLGLNEFRLDLLEYIKTHPDLEKKPFGLHSVVAKTQELPEGVIFVLKNRNNGVNIDSLNRIHPFYMVYIGIDGEIVCDYLNPKKLLDTVRLLCRGKSEPIKDAIILDFFSGSATTAHSTMQFNAEDGGNRRFILVQLPEPCDEKSEAYKAGYKNICEIGKERIRRAANQIRLNLDSQDKKDFQDLFAEEKNSANQENQANPGSDKGLDLGFRVYRLDSSNMQDVYYKPQDYNQGTLDLFADNVKEGRTAEDLLTQVMLDWGLELSLPIERKIISGKEVFVVAKNSLYCCFDDGIDEDFAKEIAQEKPMRIVFRDRGFKDDTAKENVKQLLKQLSDDTEMRVI